MDNSMDCSERPVTPEIREGSDSPFPSPDRPVLRFSESETPTLQMESLLLQTPEEVVAPQLSPFVIPVMDVVEESDMLHGSLASMAVTPSDVLEITIDDDCFSPDISEVKVMVFDDTRVPYQRLKKRSQPSMQLFSPDEEEPLCYEEAEEEPGFPFPPNGMIPLKKKLCLH